MGWHALKALRPPTPLACCGGALQLVIPISSHNLSGTKRPEPEMWGFPLSPEAFKIHKDSGLVTSRRRLQSYERFNLTVVATDKGHPPLWGTTMLHIEVIDINDNRPVFVRPPNGTILHIKEVNPSGRSRIRACLECVQRHCCL